MPRKWIKNEPHLPFKLSSGLFRDFKGNEKLISSIYQNRLKAELFYLRDILNTKGCHFQETLQYPIHLQNPYLWL